MTNLTHASLKKRTPNQPGTNTEDDDMIIEGIIALVLLPMAPVAALVVILVHRRKWRPLAVCGVGIAASVLAISLGALHAYIAGYEAVIASFQHRHHGNYVADLLPLGICGGITLGGAFMDVHQRAVLTKARHRQLVTDRAALRRRRSAQRRQAVRRGLARFVARLCSVSR